MTRSSSGDRKADRTPYLRAWFWADPNNWHWLKYNNPDLNERMYKRIVEPALKELEKTTKADLVNWQIK